MSDEDEQTEATINEKDQNHEELNEMRKSVVVEVDKQKKVDQMKNKITKKIGVELFNKVHKFLNVKKSAKVDDEKIYKSALQEFGKQNRSIIFEIDQLVFMEKN